MPPNQQQSELSRKIQQYEQFLNDVLKEDLKKCASRRAHIQAELQEYQELEQNIQRLQEVCDGW